MLPWERPVGLPDQPRWPSHYSREWDILGKRDQLSLAVWRAPGLVRTYEIGAIIGAWMRGLLITRYGEFFNRWAAVADIKPGSGIAGGSQYSDECRQ